ncbi:MAG: type II toxin-antitoxin system VapC family toxin [Hymenobacteraceae bacterium]|nr:type II toxin-antitoxin system VapC family toxin [Hymenobacteraceae bacterium]
MGLLIDTQVLIWELMGSPQQSRTVRQLLEDEQQVLHISMASLWEISIKTSLGKLSINPAYPDLLPQLRNYRLEILPISFAHTVAQHRLPWHHRDPFDRLLAAQAITEGLDLVSSDVIFDAYFTE